MVQFIRPIEHVTDETIVLKPCYWLLGELKFQKAEKKKSPVNYKLPQMKRQHIINQKKKLQAPFLFSLVSTPKQYKHAPFFLFLTEWHKVSRQLFHTLIPK